MLPNYRVIFQSGTNQGLIFPLVKPATVIGRDSESDIVIRNPEISRLHAHIHLQGEEYVLEDMGSTNGTFVNGTRLDSSYVLKDGDLVTLGEKNSFLFEMINPDPDATIANPVYDPVIAAKKPVHLSAADAAANSSQVSPVVPAPVSTVRTAQPMPAGLSDIPAYKRPGAVVPPQSVSESAIHPNRPPIQRVAPPQPAKPLVHADPVESVEPINEEVSNGLPRWAMILLIIGIIFLCIVIAVTIVTMTPIGCHIYKLFGYGCITT